MIHQADSRSKQLAWKITQQIQVRSTSTSNAAEKSSSLGERHVRRASADEALTRAFISHCTDRLTAQTATNTSFPERGELLTASDLHAVFLKQANSRQVTVIKEPQANASLLGRVSSWLGLTTPGNGRSLLDRLAQTGLPLRQELVEGFEGVHDALQKTPCPQEQLRRAQDGALLLDQLRQIGELLHAAESLQQAGHGKEAGFDSALLRKLSEDVEGTARAITQVISLSEATVAGMPDRQSWQDWVLKH